MLQLPLITQIAIWIKVAAVICGLLALPLLVGTRRKRTPNKNDIAAIALIAFGFFLQGGVEAVLRFSPQDMFGGYVLGWTGGRDEQHSSLFLYDLGFPPRDEASFPEAQRQNLFVARSRRNLIPSSFWDSNGKLLTKCEYRRWDRQITKIDALPVPGANELTAWHWASHAEGRFWFLVETLSALFVLCVCIVWFRPSLKSAALPSSLSVRAFPNRWAIRIYLAVLVLLVAWVIFVRASGRIFQYKGEVLLHRVQTLELRKSTWQDAEMLRDEYSGHVQQLGRGPCDSSRCDFRIELSHSSGLLRSPDKFWKRIWNVAWNLAGGRWTEINASVTVRNRVVLGKSFHVIVPHREGYALIADAATVRGFGLQGRRLNLGTNNLVYGRPGGCEICQALWARVTPFGNTAEMRDAFDFDLSCIGGTLRACTSVASLMPTAGRYVYGDLSSEDHLPPEPPPWAPDIVRRLGRDACRVGLIEVTRVRSADPTSAMDSAPRVSFKVLETLKDNVIHDTRRDYGCSTTPLKQRNEARFLSFDSGVTPPRAGDHVIGFWEDDSDVRAFLPFTSEMMAEVQKGIAEDTIDLR